MTKRQENVLKIYQDFKKIIRYIKLEKIEGGCSSSMYIETGRCSYLRIHCW